MNAAATSLVGYLYVAYDTLTTWLGPPDPDVTDEDKTNAEWTLTTPGGRQVSVYDFGPVGWGATGDARRLRATTQTEWHVEAETEQVARDPFGDALVPRAEWIPPDDPEYDRRLNQVERPAGLHGPRADRLAGHPGGPGVHRGDGRAGVRGGGPRGPTGRTGTIAGVTPAQPAAPPEDPVTCSKCGATAYLVAGNPLTGSVFVLDGPERTARSHPCARAATVAVLTIDTAAGTATVAPLRDGARAYVANALRPAGLTGPAEWAAEATRRLKGRSVVVLTRGSVPPDLYGEAG